MEQLSQGERPAKIKISGGTNRSKKPKTLAIQYVSAPTDLSRRLALDVVVDLITQWPICVFRYDTC